MASNSIKFTRWPQKQMKASQNHGGVRISQNHVEFDNSTTRLGFWFFSTMNRNNYFFKVLSEMRIHTLITKMKMLWNKDKPSQAKPNVGHIVHQIIQSGLNCLYNNILTNMIQALYINTYCTLYFRRNN